MHWEVHEQVLQPTCCTVCKVPEPERPDAANTVQQLERILKEQEEVEIHYVHTASKGL